MSEKEENIPSQHEGAQTDTSEEVSFESIHEAEEFFKVAERRLLDVSKWHELCGEASAKFQLTNSSGQEVSRLAEEGDYFKIDIPGPGGKSGEGNDWAQVEKIERNTNPSENNLVSIQVRPAGNPQNDTSDTSHFFDENATSTFLVERRENTVRAEVHGRNETPNSDTYNFFDKVRNTVVALGAMIGISTPQWKSLVSGLVSQKDSDL